MELGMFGYLKLFAVKVHGLTTKWPQTSHVGSIFQNQCFAKNEPFKHSSSTNQAVSVEKITVAALK